MLSLDPACPRPPTRADDAGQRAGGWLGDQLGGVDGDLAGDRPADRAQDVTLPNGAVLNYDQWDGYPAARQRLLLQAAQAAARSCSPGTSTSRASVPSRRRHRVRRLVDHLGEDSCRPTYSRSSTAFPEIVDAELAHRGYIRHTVTPQTWTAEYRTVDDVATPAVAGVDLEDVHRRRRRARRRHRGLRPECRALGWTEIDLRDDRV